MTCPRSVIKPVAQIRTELQLLMSYTTLHQTASGEAAIIMYWLWVTFSLIEVSVKSTTKLNGAKITPYMSTELCPFPRGGIHYPAPLYLWGYCSRTQSMVTPLWFHIWGGALRQIKLYRIGPWNRFNKARGENRWGYGKRRKYHLKSVRWAYFKHAPWDQCNDWHAVFWLSDIYLML